MLQEHADIEAAAQRAAALQFPGEIGLVQRNFGRRGYVLPNGEKRHDYLMRRVKDGLSVRRIACEINEMLRLDHERRGLPGEPQQYTVQSIAPSISRARRAVEKADAGTAR